MPVYDQYIYMAKRKYVFLVLICLAALGLSLYGSNAPAPKSPVKAPAVSPISNATVESSVGKKLLNITFPYRRPGVNGEILNFNFQLNYAKGQSGVFKVVPDDCLETLEINGKKIALEGEALKQHCNWQQGFEMNLKPYLNEGINKIHIVISNTGGWTGLHFIPRPN